MSYSCMICFKTIDADQIYPFFQKFKEKATEKSMEIAEENYYYSPFAQKYRNFDSKAASSIEKAAVIEDVRDWAKRCIFTYRYFYLPKQKLLGMFGVPDVLFDLFDAHIYFQNSCDQDYDYEEWQSIPVFANIASKWKNVPEKAVFDKYNNNGDLNWSQKTGFEDSKEAGYWRKTFAYDEIWAMFSNYLFDDSSVVYLSLFGKYELLVLDKFVRQCGKLSGFHFDDY